MSKQLENIKRFVHGSTRKEFTQLSKLKSIFLQIFYLSAYTC